MTSLVLELEAGPSHGEREFDFESLPEHVKVDFKDQMIVKHFKRGQNIFTEGSFPSGIYFVKEGKIKKFKTLNNGKEQIIYLCSEGEMIGYASFLGEERYMILFQRDYFLIV